MTKILNEGILIENKNLKLTGDKMSKEINKEKEKISIHRALTELKTIGKRIQKKISELNPVGIKKKDKVNIHHTAEDFKKHVQSEMDSVRDLIERQINIKNAIIASNAVTKVKIGDKTPTVAEAIAYKTMMKTDEQFYSKIKQSYDQTSVEVESAIISVEKNSLQMGMNVDKAASTDKKSNTESVNAVMEAYEKENAIEIFDPLKIMDIHKTGTDFMEKFILDIDGALSESNAITLIEV